MLHMQKEERERERTIAKSAEYLVSKAISFSLRTFSETFPEPMYSHFYSLCENRSRSILIAQLKFLNRDLTYFIVNTITDLESNFVTLNFVTVKL